MDDRVLESMTDRIVSFCEKFTSWEGTVAKLGRLSPAQMRTIGVIGRNKNLRMKDIAERMELTTGTVTVMVDRLQDMGLVERCRNETDRRSYRIALSEKGEEYFREHVCRQKTKIEKMASRLTEKEQSDFIDLLGKFTSMI